MRFRRVGSYRIGSGPGGLGRIRTNEFRCVGSDWTRIRWMRLDQLGVGRVELGREGFGSVWTDGRINIEPVPVPVSVPAPDFNIDDC